MKKGNFDFINFGHALGRSEMKKLMAGSGDDGCYTCDGGECKPYSGSCCSGWTNCVPKGTYCLFSGAGCGG